MSTPDPEFVAHLAMTRTDNPVTLTHEDARLVRDVLAGRCARTAGRVVRVLERLERALYTFTRGTP